jgi:arsenate reductase
MKSKILILCTGNSCRSQMAEGFLKSFSNEIEVYSAGTNPEKRINPFTVKVMSEVGIDISLNEPKNVNLFVNKVFDYVITVCDNAKESCPIFLGEIGETMHIGFDDPAEAKGTDEEILFEYRRIRDLIYREFNEFYKYYLTKE